MTKSISDLEKEIKAIQKKIASLGAMRPGSISCQYHKPQTKEKPFWQISFTHHGRGKTEYLRPENLEAVKEEVSRFAHFKELVVRLTDLSLEASRLRYPKASKVK